MLVLADYFFDVRRPIVVKEAVAVTNSAQRWRIELFRADVVGQIDIVDVL